VSRHAVPYGRGRIVFVFLIGLLATGMQVFAQQPIPPESNATAPNATAPNAAPAPAGATSAKPPAASPGFPVALPPPPAPEHAGKAVYDRACASCHNNPQLTRAPALDALKAMRYGQLHYALTDGKMSAQGATLKPADRAVLIDYLVGRTVSEDAWISKMMCEPRHRNINLRVEPTVAGFGFDRQNHRNLTKEQAGLEKADFPNLELAWALAYPHATTVRAQPAVVGNTLFIPVAEAPQMIALDVSRPKPCVKWVYRTDLPLRTGVGYGSQPGGRKVIAFGDVAAQITMLDAATGKLLWRTRVGMWGLSNTTGTPVIYRNRVYVPLSASEINVGADPNYECCKTHGAVLALNSINGHKVWTTHMMEDAKPVRDRGDGKMMWGPSGAPVWNSPSLDEKRGVLYVGTGEATSAPAAPNTDAILAISLKDGSIKWSFQATENDIFLSGCMNNRDGLNCPKEGHFRDVDFGASTIIAQRSNGKDVILAGQKSGTLWALDPDANGKVLWQRDFGTGSPIGGIHWGIAFDGERVFAPIHQFAGPDGKDPNQTPGLHAVKVDTGEVLWSYESKPDCSGDRQTRVPRCQTVIGLSGAPTVIDGVVLQGSVDGYLRAFDAETGEVLFQYDTAQTYETINGVAGKGGAIDNASIVATNGLVFVNSGYALMAGQPAGNVLLAFRAKKQTAVTEAKAESASQ
jgi:polyvinyl alcohol dehydrogenase (cytochrome)